MTWGCEREKLVQKVSQGLEQLVSSLGDLNQNLETVNTIGKGFEAPGNVWHQFHQSVMAPDTMANVNTRTMEQQKHSVHDTLPSQALEQEETHSVTRQPN
ncbi:unnamed protein product [Absidia cylindrospora]